MTYVAHKSHTAGQIINEEPKVKLLSDYIKQVVVEENPVPKKLTFDEWLHQSSFVEPDAGTYLWLKDCWYAALKHGKVS